MYDLMKNVNLDELPENFTEKVKMLAEDSPFIHMLGIEFLDITKGYAKARMKFVEKITNPYGSVHGGCLYSFADTVAGVAAFTYGHPVSTVSGNMNFLLHAIDTEYVYCEAREVRQGGHLAVYNISITDDKGRLLDAGTYTFFVYPDVIS